MPEPRIEVDYSGFMRALTRFVTATERPERMLGDGARTIEQASNPPRDTGRLAGSATITVQGDTAAVSWTAPYARYPHWGTRYMSADPWASEAVERAQQNVITVVTDGVEELAARQGLT